MLLWASTWVGYLLYKYKEGEQGTWVIVDIGSYQLDAITCLLGAFFPSGRALARINSMVAFEPGVILDPMTLCIPNRFRDAHSIDLLRKAPRELVRKLVESWEKHEHVSWQAPAREIRTRVLQLS